MKLPRGIFAKLVGVFLVVGLVPFLGIELWTYHQAKSTMTEAVAESWLVRLSRETAAQTDREIEGMRKTVLLWAEEERLADDARTASVSGSSASWLGITERLNTSLARRAARLGNVALACLVDPTGRVLAAAGSDRSRPATAIIGQTLAELAPGQADRQWIDEAFRTGADAPPVTAIGWHQSPLVRALGEPQDAQGYQVGFAAPLGRTADGRQPDREPDAVIAVLFRFETIQSVLDRVRQRFSDADSGDHAAARYQSGYPFMFAADADTIIAHRQRRNYGTSLVRDHGQRGFHDAILAARFGSVHYQYPPGNEKISGFAHCAAPSDGGFGWIVGVGIDQADIFADLSRFRDLLGVAALVVAGGVVVMAALISARITRPLTRLVVLTEQVARGNLDAHVDVRSRDEFALLAEAFNRMGTDLRETNQRLIQAEKDAAWREMARQVAHEIKNPLTPIMLSAQQIQRAHEDRHPQFDALLADSVQSIIEQCESLKRIAQNFSAYAAFPRPILQWHEVNKLIAKAVAQLAPPRENGAKIVTELRCPDDAIVKADQDAIRRVFLNLINNAFEAMADRADAVLTVSADVETVEGAEVVRIRVADNGRGISPSDMRRLFEPYFSTRSGGTGLGLAICRKIVTEHGGTITVDSEMGAGTTFTITLPVRRGDARALAASDDAFSETKTIPFNPA